MRFSFKRVMSKGDAGFSIHVIPQSHPPRAQPHAEMGKKKHPTTVSKETHYDIMATKREGWFFFSSKNPMRLPCKIFYEHFELDGRDYKSLIVHLWDVLHILYTTCQQRKQEE